jgi:trehalose synthase
MRLVPVWPRSLDDYRAVVAHDIVTNLQRQAWELQNLRVLHINSTSYGGGVAEVLLAQMPLLRDAGLDAHWGVIDGDERFFTITKSFHNAIQGSRELPWTDDMDAHYRSTIEANLDSIPTGWDIAVVHDPQPLAIPHLLGDDRHKVARHWVWRCHIDASDPSPEIWKYLCGYMEPYEAAVFTMQDFVQPGLGIDRIVISPPSIDPMSPKNSPLADVTVTDICHQYQIDRRRPVIAQVSRFDPWKDPFGVIEAYRLVKQEIPDVQLILAGSLAHDDPEGLRMYDELLSTRADDRDLFVLSNLQEVGNTAINCFQRAAQVVIQKSLKEGFGLTVSEAAWKSKPMVGGRAGGIRLQIEEGRTGYLVDSVESCAERTLELLRDPGLAATMGEAGRALIRDRFLLTRDVADWLNLFTDLVAA